jgi:light-regulated signal transduction histidine kinase (bacteriophytochrome)
MGYSNILEEDHSPQLDDEARRLTSVIKKNTLKMGQLIDDLLAFSKAGKIEIHKVKVDTSAMVAAIVAESAGSERVKWNIAALPSVNADSATLRQVWINLISNAIKYSNKKEEAVIEIGFYLEEGSVVFFIKDNGAGFDEKYKHKLFKVFQRLHRGDEFEGTGIGLSLVEKIISRHGGRVWAEGQPGEGACFYFSLPQ